MKGRKPKPSALKRAEGNPGKRRLTDDEPKPEAGAPKCPPHLKGQARKEWKRIVPELLALGLLTRIDLVALSCYCTAWGRHLDAERQLATDSLTIVTDKCNTIPNPLIGISNSSAKLAKSLLVEFGLTPSSRTRLHVKPAKTAADELNDFLDAPPLRIAQ